MGETPILVGADLRSRLLGMILVNVSMTILLVMLYIGGLRIVLWCGIRDETTAHMLATVSLAVYAIPLRRRLVIISNRILRIRWQDSDEILREFGAALSQTIEPEALRALLVDDLPQRLRLQGATLWMLEPPDDRSFTAIGRSPQLAEASLLAQGASAMNVHACRDYVRVADHRDAEWAAPFVAQHIGIVIPLRAGKRLVGMYGCGVPLKRRPYPYRTVNVLMNLAPAVAGALENTRAYTKIARLNQQLRALDTLKDEFIEHVGHELRTPVTSLSLALQLVGREPGLMNELSRVMHSSVAQLEVLVDRILLLDRYPAEATLQPPQATEAIEIRPLLEEIAQAFQLTAQAKGLRLHVHATEGLAAWGRTAMVYRAIHEVMDNAVRYSDRGTIRLSAQARDGLAIITVEDQGPGIPFDERDMLFDAFYRGRHTRALAEQPGAGIGLSLARRNIEALGGRIWLEHSSAAGSIMAIALPAVALSVHEYGGMNDGFSVA